MDTVGVRKIAGLGINITEIYLEGRSYLKGLFNALESWRGWRDVEGWRLQKTTDALESLMARSASRAEL